MPDDTVWVKNIADIVEINPINKNSTIALVIFCSKIDLKFLIIGYKKKRNVNKIRKSSRRIDTYTPIKRKLGNFGYRGIKTRSAVINDL